MNLFDFILYILLCMYYLFPFIVFFSLVFNGFIDLHIIFLLIIYATVILNFSILSKFVSFVIFVQISLLLHKKKKLRVPRRIIKFPIFLPAPSPPSSFSAQYLPIVKFCWASFLLWVQTFFFNSPAVSHIYFKNSYLNHLYFAFHSGDI